MVNFIPGTGWPGGGGGALKTFLVVGGGGVCASPISEKLYFLSGLLVEISLFECQDYGKLPFQTLNLFSRVFSMSHAFEQI